MKIFASASFLRKEWSLISSCLVLALFALRTTALQLFYKGLMFRRGQALGKGFMSSS